MNTFKRKALIAALLGGAVFVSGCTGLMGSKEDAPAAQKVEVVQATPACSLTAAPGQVLKIEGLSKLECYGGQSQPQIIQTGQSAPHPVWSIAASALNVLGTVAGVKYAGDNTVNLVRAIGGITSGFSVQPNITVGQGATASFGSSTATGANSGSNSGNSGRIGNDDNSQRPTSTVTCATGPGASGAAGGVGGNTGTTGAGGAGGVGGAGAPSGSVNCNAGR